MLSQKNSPSSQKALIIVAVFILFFSTFLFLLLGRMLFPEKKIIFDQTNNVFVVKGDVKIKKAKVPTPWQGMDSSSIIEKGDIVETAYSSTVDITIGADINRALKVKESSRVEFEGVNPTNLSCPKGKILATLKKLEPKSSFTVKTPTAICGARGTAWSVETDGNKTKICVFEGTVYARELDANGLPKPVKHAVEEGTQRILQKDKPISDAQKIGKEDLDDWKYWDKNITFLREGKILVDDFNKEENFNNLGGPFGSWVVFYSDLNQYCRDEFSPSERRGNEGFGLKLDYDVDSPSSAYNGFFTNLMGIDLSGYKYLIFYIKGDRKAGYTTKFDVELKNKFQVGKIAVKGITGEWQKIVLPLEKFKGITGFTSMKEFVIVFSDLNATKKEGIVYIDDIYFSKTE